MIPALIEIQDAPWRVLPAGQHIATLNEVADAFATNPLRRELYNGLLLASKALHIAGCSYLYLDGSYVTGKPKPGDYDACWDPRDVDINQLDSVFLNFDNKRYAQKIKYGGEFFPFHFGAGNGQSFLEFFQTDRFTGATKGIIVINLNGESFDTIGGIGHDL